MKNTTLFSVLFLISMIGYTQELQLKLASDVWPPFTNTGKNTAFALDLVKLALNRTGVSIENEITDFNHVMEGIQKGEINGSSALWKDQEREEYMLFSDPYLHNQLVLVGKKGSDVSQKSLNELKNKRVGIVGSYAYGSDIEDAIGVNWVQGKNDQDNLNKLLQEEVDYILVDALLIEYLLNYQKEEALQHIAIGNNTLIRRALHFAIGKNVPGAQDIIERFNREIILMVADGSYNKVLHLNWIKADIDGDGKVELVMEGKNAGSIPPENAYSVFMTNQSNFSSGTNTRYYVSGSFYDNWEKIPDEYKVPKMKEEDLSKIGLLNFRF